MSAPLPDPPVFHPGNITGSLGTTLGAIAAAIAAYFAANGDKFPPSDTVGWITFGAGLLVAIAGALWRGPSGSSGSNG